jgi:adenylate cyclase
LESLKTKLVAWVFTIGATPGDGDNLRLKKSLMVVLSLPFVVAGLLWGILYFSFGEKLAGSIPFSYGIFSLLSIFHFGITGKFQLFRFSQLLLVLLLPFLLMMSLGGFIGGSSVILWSLICPLGALLFDEAENALKWFLAFIGLVVFSGLIQPYLPFSSDLPATVIIFFFVINLFGVSGIIFLMLYYFNGQKNIFQEKSESLLANILPHEIATILKEDQHSIADHYENTSVLFADVVGFTGISEKLSPQELVSLLDTVFSAFDLLVEKYGLEKIKTIGDCYMVAAGVPSPREDHALALTDLAVDMRNYVSQNVIEGQNLSFRIGLNSGPVVAGVIGRKKFIYDLWGDVVNTASRMESHGQEGCIQVTRATYELIKEEFNCTSQGLIQTKGKGELETWFVEGRMFPR